MYAAERGNTDTVKILLEYGAKVNTKDKNGIFSPQYNRIYLSIYLFVNIPLYSSLYVSVKLYISIIYI